ncbi:MAG: 1-deoxy-D-xylulose-5-phosphate synthase [Candidatus Omnitrophica bacterium]|nr:1-deoxy-D-xylulose-5-phosphate synthase [Candidatus Omnitrophota bacterium]
MKKIIRSEHDLRDAFFNELYKIAKLDKNIILLSDDFGAPSLDKFREDLAQQYYNAGISEQNMVSVAAGLALSGKKVYMYAIAPFVTLRCYEQFKIDLCSMDLPVTALGVGSGYAYSSAGPTHHAIEDIAVMRALPNLTILSPSDSVMAAAFADMSYELSGPKYIRFDRGKLPLIHSDNNDGFADGMSIIKKGSDLCIIATGTMVQRAIEVAEELAGESVDAGIIDLYRLKPVNRDLLLQNIVSAKKILTLEEHVINGGIGSIVAEILCDATVFKPLKRIAIDDQDCFSYGDREYLQRNCGLDGKTVSETILGWIR